jgi:hypothetical protein
MKYQTATTEQRAGQTTPDGTPLAPNPPDQSGDWQLIGLHAFMRFPCPLPSTGAISVFSSPSPEWFIHFYWQRVEPAGQRGGDGQT